MNRKKLAAIAILLANLPFAAPGVRAQELPPFLKPYYAPMFAVSGQTLQLTDHGEKDNITHYYYSSTDMRVSLAVEYFPCQGDVCRTIFSNALVYTNGQAKAGSGQFGTVNDSEYRAEWTTSGGHAYTFVFRLPSSIQFWTYAVQGAGDGSINAGFDQLVSLVNRQRYDDAGAAGNIEMGRWDAHLREFARQLLKEQDVSNALIVLQNVIATAPFDFEAQMDFAMNTPDKTLARNSAMAVLDNAESPELLAKAAKFLAVMRPDAASLPLVNKNDRGLQVVLVPLGNADVGLLNETAAIYSRITNVPVKLKRLEDEFHFRSPDRLLDQRAIQQTIVQSLGPGVDFTGWDMQRYQAALLRTVANAEPLARFQMRTFVNALASRPGQYLIDPYLAQFGEMLLPVRSNDPKTIYVGVTNDNIYSGDVNFVFSQSEKWKGSYVGILSYGMMTAETLKEPYESRKRLAERLAKELVPASLKALEIPRAVDPTDPYSYSNGVERLNEKTLILSRPTKEALDKFR